MEDPYKYNTGESNFTEFRTKANESSSYLDHCLINSDCQDKNVCCWGNYQIVNSSDWTYQYACDYRTSTDCMRVSYYDPGFRWE